MRFDLSEVRASLLLPVSEIIPPDPTTFNLPEPSQSRVPLFSGKKVTECWPIIELGRIRQKKLELRFGKYIGPTLRVNIWEAAPVNFSVTELQELEGDVVVEFEEKSSNETSEKYEISESKAKIDSLQIEASTFRTVNSKSDREGNFSNPQDGSEIVIENFDENGNPSRNDENERSVDDDSADEMCWIDDVYVKLEPNCDYGIVGNVLPNDDLSASIDSVFVPESLDGTDRVTVDSSDGCDPSKNESLNVRVMSVNDTCERMNHNSLKMDGISIIKKSFGIDKCWNHIDSSVVDKESFLIYPGGIKCLVYADCVKVEQKYDCITTVDNWLLSGMFNSFENESNSSHNSDAILAGNKEFTSTRMYDSAVVKYLFLVTVFKGGTTLVANFMTAGDIVHLSSVFEVIEIKLSPNALWYKFLKPKLIGNGSFCVIYVKQRYCSFPARFGWKIPWLQFEIVLNSHDLLELVSGTKIFDELWYADDDNEHLDLSLAAKNDVGVSYVPDMISWAALVSMLKQPIPFRSLREDAMTVLEGKFHLLAERAAVEGCDVGDQTFKICGNILVTVWDPGIIIEMEYVGKPCKGANQEHELRILAAKLSFIPWELIIEWRHTLLV
ncbi:OLC1v1037488C1 [Oldenlandia corymbosa var. corymbosa]|uniref:OLC1v1037488C1 n=1 Tax=Oldenlandia corymbosa var. corymbosa TaxID=529605 RepID=A0AAV1E3J5_OLDCO|nr:OLC1v1037488C1 [Oldenlandia corymbosa var. corymbosa]